MLVQITIRNLALIEKLIFEPQRGFNVLTGETGAGKSMIALALSLIMGERANPELVRVSAKEAEVEALFEYGEGTNLHEKLQNAGIPFDSNERHVVIRRIVSAEGRSKAYINGRLSTAAELVALAPELCDIASQHESVSLTDASVHGDYLDAYGKLESERVQLAEYVFELQKVQSELERLQHAEQTRLEREDYLRFQKNEIDEFDPKLNEDTDLLLEKKRLKNADALMHATQHSQHILTHSDGSVTDALTQVISHLQFASSLDPNLLEHQHKVEIINEELKDVARALVRYSAGIESNSERLQEVEERWFQLSKLLRKHGPGMDLLLERRDKLDREISELESSSELLSELEQKKQSSLKLVAKLAKELSSKRKVAAKKLGEAVAAELADLGMGKAKVKVDVALMPAQERALSVDGAKLTPSGIDKVEFLIAPNPGEEPKPLRKIASGGELSRALLALKCVLAENGPAGLYVFDEVDSGVSGAVAEAIGRKISELASYRQVLCITHLSQIASLADTHFLVGKLERKGRTVSEVRKLSEPERVEEISRMMGGAKIGQATKKAAAELLASRSTS